MKSLNNLVSIVCVLLVTVVGVGEANGPPTGAPFVYVSSNEEIEGDSVGRILRIFTDGSGDFECILEQDDLQLEDMVIGPDGLLYAGGTYDEVPMIIRLIPSDDPDGCELDLCHTDVEIVYDGSAENGPSDPVAPWFNFNGDLLISDRGGSVWAFEGISDIPLGCLVGSDDFCDEGAKSSSAKNGCDPTTIDPSLVFSEDDFVGEGLTQQAQGHLIVADRENDVIWQYTMDISGQFFGIPQPLIFNPDDESDPVLVEPTGLARLPDGTIFFTDIAPHPEEPSLMSVEKDSMPMDGVLYRIPSEGTEEYSPTPCVTFEYDRAFFVEAEADFVMWLATGSAIWRVEYDKENLSCLATPVFPAPPSGPQKIESSYHSEFRGVAVPPTFINGGLVDDDAYDGLMFSQGDNALQVVAGNGCEATLQVYEALSADIEALVALLPVEDQDVMTDAFLGDNGRFQVFDIRPTNEDCEIPGELVQFTISSFFQYGPETSGTAAIIHCTDAVEVGEGFECEDPLLDPEYPDTPADGGYWDWGGPLCCDVIPLSNFSLSGFIPDDGRRTGTSPAFSLLVAAEQPKKASGEDGAGDFCGLKPPVKNNAVFGTPVPPDPLFDPDDFPTFRMGRTLPLKFNVVDLPDTSKGKKPKAPSCKKGPYLRDLTIALSITRIAKPDGEGGYEATSDMVHPIPSGKGDIDEFGRAIFGESGSKYHFNWRLKDLPDPGIYELFIIPDDSNFTPAIEYVLIK